MTENDCFVKIDLLEYLELQHQSILWNKKNIEEIKDRIDTMRNLKLYTDHIGAQEKQIKWNKDRAKAAKEKIETLIKNRPHLIQKYKRELVECSKTIEDCIFEKIKLLLAINEGCTCYLASSSKAQTVIWANDWHCTNKESSNQSRVSFFFFLINKQPFAQMIEPSNQTDWDVDNATTICSKNNESSSSESASGRVSSHYLSK